MKNKGFRLSGKRLLMLAGVVLLLASAAAVYFTWRDLFREVKTSDVPTSAYQTQPVVQGDLALSATGSGSLVAGSEADVGFPLAGRLAELNVQVGDVVSAGDVLAVLDGVDQLEINVKTKTIQLNQAKEALAEYQSSGDENLAQSGIDLADAQAAYQDALDNLHQKGDERCEDDLTSRYYYQYLEYIKQLKVWEDELAGDSKYGRDFILEHVYPLRKSRNTAYANWAYCDAYTDQEIAESQSTMQLAQANLDLSQAAYQKLSEVSGVDPKQVELLTAQVNNAQAQLAVAKDALENAVLKAPMDGTVVEITAAVGEAVGTSTLISLADLDHPQVQVQLDETDLQNIAVGCSAQLTFDSIADRTFNGSVTQVSPALVSSNGYDAVQGIIQMDAVAQTFPIGLNASVDVVCGQADNALLVPMAALHVQADGTYAVYILNGDGSVEQRAVEIGLQDATSTEVRSGLRAGELVITQGPGIPNG